MASRRLPLDTRPLAGEVGPSARSGGRVCGGRPRVPPPAPGPDHGLVRAARAAGVARASSAQRSLAVAIFPRFALIDMSNGPKTPPLPPATCICSATGAAAGRRRSRHRPGRHAGGRDRAWGSPQGPGRAGPRRLPRRRRGGQPAPPCGRGSSRAAKRHAAAPAHAPLGPFSRGFPRRPPRDGPT